MCAHCGGQRLWFCVLSLTMHRVVVVVQVQDSLAVIHAAGGAGTTCVVHCSLPSRLALSSHLFVSLYVAGRVPKSRRLMNSTGAGQTSGGSGSGSGSGSCSGSGSGSGSGGGGGSGSGDADTPMNPYLALAHKYVPTPSHLAQKQSHSKSTGGPAVLNRTGDADIQPLVRRHCAVAASA